LRSAAEKQPTTSYRKSYTSPKATREKNRALARHFHLRSEKIFMPIDAHAHYVTPRIVEKLQQEGARYGIDVIEHPRAWQRRHPF